MTDLFEFILDSDLELDYLVLVLGTGDALAHLEGLLVHATLVQALGVIDLVVLCVWEETGQLVVHVGRVLEVLHMVIAVAQQAEGRSVARVELELIGQDVDDVHVLLSWIQLRAQGAL